MEKAVVKKRKMKDYNRMGYLFVLPFVIVFCIFNVYPVLRTFYLSFTNFRGFGEATWIGLDNYIRAFGDRFFRESLVNTVKIWGVNIVLQLGIAFLLMMVFSDIKYKMSGLRVFRIVYYLPNLIACTSVAFLFNTLLDWRHGQVNHLITIICNALGITNPLVNWIGDPNTAWVVISVIQTWMWFGNSFIMLMAGVQGISKDYFEAAAIDGAGRWTVFGKITLPLLRPILLYVAITSLIGGLQMFDLPYLMVEKTNSAHGTVQTAMMYLYKFGFETGTTQVGYASAIAYILFMIILTVSVLQLKIFGGKEK